VARRRSSRKSSSRKSSRRKSNKRWIQGAVKKPGALRKSMGVKKGQKIPASRLRAAAKKKGKLGQRARFALNMRKIQARRKRRG
jgi:hypothetical protein